MQNTPYRVLAAAHAIVARSIAFNKLPKIDSAASHRTQAPPNGKCSHPQPPQSLNPIPARQQLATRMMRLKRTYSRDARHNLQPPMYFCHLRSP
jgi:hypothetical protein